MWSDGFIICQVQIQIQSSDPKERYMIQVERKPCLIRGQTKIRNRISNLPIDHCDTCKDEFGNVFSGNRAQNQNRSKRSLRLDHAKTPDKKLDQNKRIYKKSQKDMCPFLSKYYLVSLGEVQRYIIDHKDYVDLEIFVWQSLVYHIRTQIVVFHRFQASVSQYMFPVRLVHQ